MKVKKEEDRNDFISGTFVGRSRSDGAASEKINTESSPERYWHGPRSLEAGKERDY